MPGNRRGLAPHLPENFGIGRLFGDIRDAAIVAEVASGRVVLWNPAAERLFGYPAADAIGQLVEDLIVPRALRATYRAGLSRYRRTGHSPLVDAVEPVELGACTRTGAELAIELSLTPLGPTPDGRRFVLALIRDATERREARRTLEEQAELLGLAHDAIFVRDLHDGTIRFWNRGAEELYGWTRDDAVGRVSRVLLQTEFSQPLELIEAELRRTGHWEGELVHWTRAGKRVVVLSRWAVQRQERGEPIAFLEIDTDITDRKRAEAERAELAREQAARAQAEAALRERDRVLATISHDLKAPLTTIGGQAQLLRRYAKRAGVLELERALKGLALIETAVTKMAGWIDELLDTARLEAGRPLELRPEPTDLVALAWQAAAEQQPGTQRHRIRVATTERELIGVWDPARLGRVLDNLVSNAVKFSPAGGEVIVSVACEEDTTGSWAVVRVRDQGVGIPAADQAHIFERFRRGANVVGRIAGTGIGLAGACQIVEQHGGTIGVESQEGAGSTFTVRLPLDFRRADA